MSYLARSIKGILVPSVLVLLAASAHAQATRTWVSGVGDDANPCSRTAPCKTYAGAISKTAAGGEINTLDPGGFGAVTITKSIHIRAEGAQEGGSLVSGTNAFVISAGASDAITIEGQDIDGLGTGLAAVRILSAGSVSVEKCRIYGFVNAGIDFESSSAGAGLFVTDTIITASSSTTQTLPFANSGAVYIGPTGAGGTFVLDNVRIFKNNNAGVQVNGANSTAAINGEIRNSDINFNTGFGVYVNSATTATSVMIDGSSSSNNSGNGIQAVGAAAMVRVATSTITNNNVGVKATQTAQIISAGNNALFGNTTSDGAFSSTPGTK